MARIWSKRQLERTTPPQARDIRGEAFLAAVNRMLGNRPLPGPQMRDPEICLAEVLPALVAEWSMEEFIDHSWPEHVQRRVLAKPPVHGLSGSTSDFRAVGRVPNLPS